MAVECSRASTSEASYPEEVPPFVPADVVPSRDGSTGAMQQTATRPETFSFHYCLLGCIAVGSALPALLIDPRLIQWLSIGGEFNRLNHPV